MGNARTNENKIQIALLYILCMTFLEDSTCDFYQVFP